MGRGLGTVARRECMMGHVMSDMMRCDAMRCDVVGVLIRLVWAGPADGLIDRIG